MRKPISTVSRRSSKATALVVVASLVIPIALVGIARAPLRASKAAREYGAAAQARRAVLDREQELLLSLESAGAIDRLDQLIGAVREAIPERTDKVRVFYLIQLFSRTLGIELETLTTGEPEALGLPISDEDIGQRRVMLRGHGTLRNLIDLVEALRVSGFSMAIQETRTSRESSQSSAASIFDQSYSFSMTLVLFERIQALEAYELSADREQ